VPGYPPPAYVAVGQLAIDPTSPQVIWADVAQNVNATTINCWRIQIQ
jgi:hypothetical protein